MFKRSGNFKIFITLQATIYKKLAAEELQDQRREMITSEMRSQHIILLTKARECFYLTLDRLRSPGVDAKHPLNAELNSHIEDIESQLSRIDPDVMLAGGDGMSFLSDCGVHEKLGHVAVQDNARFRVLFKSVSLALEMNSYSGK